MAELRFLRRHSVSQTGARRLARGAAAAVALAAACSAAGLVPDSLIRIILEEVSAENALRETAELASRVRYPNSQGFLDAAEHVAAQARGYGLQNVSIERFPEPQPMWDPLEAELEIVAPARRMLSTFERESLLLARRSRDGDITAELAGESGDVKGKVVLTPRAPDEAWRSLKERGAVALICAHRPEYFGRQPAVDAVAWGEAPEDALALMISPRQGDELRASMKQGPVTVRLHARARRTNPGAIAQVMGEIPGEMKDQDIVLAAHLDHQKPGANDNASGSGALLEIARTVNRLVASGKIARPRRTLRFWWSTEIRSEQEYFRKHPEEAKKIVMAVVLDQAGGDRRADNSFIVIYGPDRLPSFADDLAHNLAEFVKNEYAPAEHQPSPLLVAEGGGTQSMRTVYWDYAPLSDHVSFESREVGIPAISLAVPSLHVIHTNQDTVDRLDPTWMKRSALMALAPALYVANAGPREAAALLDVVFHRAAERLAAADDPKGRAEIERKRLSSVTALDSKLDTATYAARLAAVAKELEK